MIMWKPIITNQESKKKIVAKIVEMVNCIENQALDFSEIGLLSGSTGYALFLFYYSKLSKNKKYNKIAYNVLVDVVNKINQEKYNFPTFCEGLSGIVWCFEFLLNNKFLKDNPNEIFVDIYDYLSDEMTRYTESNNFDYLHGSIGISFLLMKEKKYHEIIANNLNHIVKEGERSFETIKWKTTIYNGGNEGYNFSLAHGSASILYFFLMTFKNNIKRDFSKKIAYEIINSYLNYLFDLRHRSSIFPSVVLTSGQTFDSRLAWCYGDTGVCSILLLAADILKDEKLKSIAIETLIKTTKRKTEFETEVVDAGFCHGSVGLAHIYSRAYNLTGLNVFREAAEYWVFKTLDFSVYKDGFAGYKTYHGDEGWVSKMSLLEGISGIGLTLISQVSQIEPSWDKCFLLST